MYQIGVDHLDGRGGPHRHRRQPVQSVVGVVGRPIRIHIELRRQVILAVAILAAERPPVRLEPEQRCTQAYYHIEVML